MAAKVKKTKKPAFPKTIYLSKRYGTFEFENNVTEAFNNGNNVVAEYQLVGSKKLVVSVEDI